MQTEGLQVNDRELMTAVKSKLCEHEFSAAQRQQSINKAVEWLWVFKTDKKRQEEHKGTLQSKPEICVAN
jgi:hypothetical protein